MKLLNFLIIPLILLGCSQNKSTDEQETTQVAPDNTETLVDSLLYFRHQSETSDILSRHLPDISREKAIEIQLAMLEKEMAAGAQQIGWKMGGTVTDDSASYDPVFGYVLDKHQVQAGGTVAPGDFPGGQVMVEGEVGFVLGKDFQNGAASLEELKAGIDYVVGAVEFAQAIAVPVAGKPESQNINHVLASGMGHAGIIVGSEQISLDEFDMESETVTCYIDGEVAAEGVATNVFRSPLHALYSLVNMLPKYGTYLKKGDVVVTGSLYQNPTIDGTADVRLEFSTLGEITFSME